MYNIYLEETIKFLIGNVYTLLNTLLILQTVLLRGQSSPLLSRGQSSPLWRILDMYELMIIFVANNLASVLSIQTMN